MSVLSSFPVPSALRLRDLLALGASVLRTRRFRSALAVVGVAMGVACLIAVGGISASGRAELIAQLDKLGTNMLTLRPNAAIPGEAPTLPLTATPMLERVRGVLAVAEVEQLPLSTYRSERMPNYDTNGISVYTAGVDLLSTLGGSLVEGAFLNTASSRLPIVVLGAGTAAALGIDRLASDLQVVVGGQRFSVGGILNPFPLVPDLDAAAFVGEQVAARLFAADGHASLIFVRANPDQVPLLEPLLGPTANPDHPEEVQITRPSDALAARAAAKGAFVGLGLALAAVALLIGGIGIANVMVIGVVERRREIGTRRSLGASPRQIRAQFLVESLLLGAIGGMAGLGLGAAIVICYAISQHTPVVISPESLVGAVTSAVVIGGCAGLYPANRAARLAPIEALRE